MFGDFLIEERRLYYRSVCEAEEEGKCLFEYFKIFKHRISPYFTAGFILHIEFRTFGNIYLLLQLEDCSI